jgi:hypothetical protein
MVNEAERLQITCYEMDSADCPLGLKRSNEVNCVAATAIIEPELDFLNSNNPWEFLFPLYAALKFDF